MKHLFWQGGHHYGRCNEFVTDRMKRVGVCDPGHAPKPRDDKQKRGKPSPKHKRG